MRGTGELVNLIEGIPHLEMNLLTGVESWIDALKVPGFLVG